ncbi:hypothetical protein F4774DRAFT_379244 [Daldinia eschscholtzii]|nr:hypothetical protein F4774DRAFT_379244 [Daldinia eschscholtzii]
MNIVNINRQPSEYKYAVKYILFTKSLRNILCSTTSIMSTAIHDQSQSPFFSRFPGEIRNTIYEYYRINSSPSYNCRDPIDPREITAALSKLTSLHKTCKRVYNEVRDILYASNAKLTIHLDQHLQCDYVNFQSGGMLIPSRLRSLDISYTRGAGYAHNLVSCFYALNWMAPNIRQIRININHDPPNFTYTEEFQGENLLTTFNRVVRSILSFKQLESITFEGCLNINLIKFLHEKLIGNPMNEKLKFYKVVRSGLPREALRYETVSIEASDLEMQLRGEARRNVDRIS